MNILYIGHGITHMGNWPESREWDERHIVKGFRANGHHTVYVFSPDHRPNEPFDLVVWNKRVRPTMIQRADLMRIKRRYKCPQVYWHCDGFHITPAMPRPNEGWFWKVARDFDMVLLPEGTMLPRYEAAARTRFRYMQYACDLDYCPPNAEPVDAWRCDVGFIGKRQSGVARGHIYGNRNRLLDTLAGGFDLGVWSISPREWKAAGIDARDPVCGVDFARACRSAKILIGASQKSWCWGGWSTRAVNVMACGGFLLHENTPGFADFFQPGVHCDVFRPDDANDAAERIRYWLGHPDDRERVARQGQAHVRANHNWQVRTAEVLALMRKEKLL